MKFSTVALALASLIPLAQGSTITSIAFGSSSIGLSPTSTVSTPCPANDSSTFSPCNTMNLIETWTSVNSQNFGVAYNESGSAGVEDYFVTKTITNNTGQTWGDLTVFIGAGTIDFQIPATVAVFDLGAPGDGLFTPVLTGGSGANTLMTATPNLLHWDNLNVSGSGGIITIQYGFDTNSGGSGTWQILQRASLVPEPAAVALT